MSGTEQREPQQKEAEKAAPTREDTDKENQMPVLEPHSLQQDGTNTKANPTRKKKGEGKVKRSSNRQVTQV